MKAVRIHAVGGTEVLTYLIPVKYYALQLWQTVHTRKYQSQPLQKGKCWWRMMLSVSITLISTTEAVSTNSLSQQYLFYALFYSWNFSSGFLARNYAYLIFSPLLLSWQTKILGREGAGSVEAVGEDVTNYKVGDKVAYLLYPLPSIYPFDCTDTFQEVRTLNIMLCLPQRHLNCQKTLAQKYGSFYHWSYVPQFYELILQSSQHALTICS